MLRFIIIGLVFFLVAFVVLAVILRRARLPGLAPGRRPRPRHRIVRIVCGVLGGGILVAVAIGTIVEVKRCYEPYAPVPAPTVRVPTKPAPTPTARMPEHMLTWPVLEETRFILNLVVLDPSGGEPRVVAARPFDLRVNPTVSHNVSDLQFKYELRRNGYALKVQGVLWSADFHRRDENATPEIQGGGSMTVWVYSASSNSLLAMRNYLPKGPVWHEENLPCGSMSVADPFFAVPVPRSQPMVWCFLTPVAQDDPLKEIPASALVQSHLDEMDRAGFAEEALRASLPAERPSGRMPALGLLLGDHLGLCALFLLIAVALLTEVFTRRGIAYALILAATILYAAALDRVALGMHLARLEDQSAAVAVRRIACIQATETFFYGKTALVRLQAVAKDDASPKELRDLAAEAAERMGARM